MHVVFLKWNWFIIFHYLSAVLIEKSAQYKYISSSNNALIGEFNYNNITSLKVPKKENILAILNDQEKGFNDFNDLVASALHDIHVN